MNLCASRPPNFIHMRMAKMCGCLREVFNTLLMCSLWSNGVPDEGLSANEIMFPSH